MASFNQAKQTSIYVRLPPIGSLNQQSKFLDKVCIYFQKTRVSQGSDVQEVHVISSDNEALWLRVTFSEPSGVEHTLALEHHELVCDGETIHLHVQSSPPTPDSTEPPADTDTDSDLEIISLDSLTLHDDDVGSSKGSERHTHGKPAKSGHPGHGKNPFIRPTTWMEQVSSVNESVAKTPHLYPPTNLEQTANPTCLAQPFPPPSPAAVHAPPFTTSATMRAPIMSHRASSLTGVPPNVSPTVLPAAPSAPPTSHSAVSSTTTLASQLSSDHDAGTGAASGVWDFRTPSAQILSYQKMNQRRDACEEDGNLVPRSENGAVYRRDSEPNFGFNFTPDNPPSMAYWNTTGQKTGFDSRIWSNVIPLNNPRSPWHAPAPASQPPPGFGFPGLGRGMPVRGTTGPQQCCPTSIPPPDVGELTLPMQSHHRYSMPLGDPNFLAASPVSKKSSHQVTSTSRIPGIAVRATPAREDNPFLTEKSEKQQDDHSDSDEEETEEEQLVEVTDFKPTTSDEMLRLYFENPRKSRGGDIEAWEKDIKSGAIRIKYSDPSIAKAVTERAHKVERCNLSVRLIVKKKPRPRPVKKRCLFLSGIPDECNSEHLLLYLENCSSMDEPRVQYGEMPGTALCTFAEDIPDLQKVINKISSKKLQKAQVTAELVHESDCILVQGLTSETSLDFIELYFDNKKKSGGSGVREVLPGNAEDQAIVYFEDWKVVSDVLSRKEPHKVCNTLLTVEEYHDCLGRLTSLDAPTPHIPKPISVMVPIDIMEFIYRKGQETKKKLVGELRKINATLTWPDGDKKTAARLEPLVGDGQRPSVWINWSQLCREALTSFLDGCTSTTVPVATFLWKEATAKLAKISTSQTCLIVLEGQTHSVRFVGEKKDVDEAIADTKNVIKELQAKADRDAQQTKQDIGMAPHKLQLFLQCGIRSKMEHKFPDLKITVTSAQGQVGITLEGKNKNVKDAELLMRRQMDELSNKELKTGRNKTEFVRRVSDKMHEIWGSQKISAACDISADGKITIYGASKTDTSRAKTYIDQEIDEDVIRINGPAVSAALKSQGGLQLIDGINKKKFAMADINYKSGNVELAGFKTELKEAKQHILMFLKDNVTVKGTIRATRSKVRLITSFHGQELADFTTKHQRDRVTIQPQRSRANKGFLLEANEEGLNAASQFIHKLLAEIKEKPYPVSKIGMAQLFRETKGKNFLESVEKKLKCVIDVVGDEEDDIEEGSNASQSPGTTEVLCKITLPDGCTLRVCKGDLTKQIVDCIVNAANEDLKHIGGLAAAILQAGGQIIQTESDQKMKEKGRKLYVGEPVYTSSGNLPCKKVIHMAGPRWSRYQASKSGPDDEPTHEEHLLFDGIVACLQMADKLRFQSIAIPAISTGIYGFPIKLAAVQIVNAVAEFCQNKPDTTLTEISLTNNDQPTCDAMRKVVLDQLGYLQEKELGIDDTQGVGGSSLASYEPAVVASVFTSSGPNILTTKEGVTVTLKKGSITEEMADVLVNTSGTDLNLSIGLVSQALLKVAGPALQQECNAVITARGKVSAGSFVETGSANLTNCKKIFHCVIDRYQSSASEKPLATLVEGLLMQAEIIEALSLAIPALGTGNLGYPPDVTARVMYEAVLAFSSQHPNAVLKDIRFVVYDKDTKTIKGFEGEIGRLTSGAVRGAAAPAVSKRKLKKSVSTSAVGDRHSYSQIHRNSDGAVQAQIGPVCLQIRQGDLVKEKSHAIVNSVGEKLDLQGPVSSALLAKGGEKIRKECDDQRRNDPTKTVYVTKAGKLQCNLIFHVVTPKTPEDIKAVVAKTLKQAEERKVKSISFPALGTGFQAGQAVSSSASSMLAAIGEFACRENPRHLHLIRLVIYKREMLPGFEDALKQEEGRSFKKQAGLLSRSIEWAKSFMPGAATNETSDDEAPQETLLLQICAMDDVTIQKATDEIDKFQSEEFTSEDMPDDHGMTAKLTEEHQAELRNIERKYNVHIELSKGHAKFVRVEGTTINVKDARFRIQELFTRMQVQETEKQRNEYLTKEVQWKYITSTGAEDYDAEVNAIIEDAYQKKRPLVTLDLEEGRVTVDFKKMKELSRAGSLSINRIDLQQATKFEPPSSWIPMQNNEHLQLVKLAAGTQEYTDVESSFRLSMGSQAPVNQIVEILRIQNIELLMQYQARKTALEARLGRTNIEETLYHGTDEQTCDKINKFGFNRSFCGKNATVYGNGTYFAVEASYSARSQYAKPNASNTKHIYATKVLVGDFTTGSGGMVVPPNKPNNPDQLFDSVVDNTSKPSIYVIFHDAQAYPEYLIKFN
ncbi:poly [ADP-ribose] polymerase 14-like [Acanthaster planci]|uniref:Poly [ADP-ribose] polymerase n=1 Tax=Acanthaster planci TaxID=133434 RepID=A0A8B7YV52_ACAPL|nr:poly [ADP-ribose] polymerase 14-like [Acanthaster planci]